MKLSKLLTYKEMINGLDVKHVHGKFEDLLKNVSSDLDIQNIDFNNLKYVMKMRQKTIMDNLIGLQEDLDKYKSEINNFFNTIEQPYFKKSEDIYNEGRNDDYDYKLDRNRFKNLLYEQETRDLFIGRMNEYTDWKYPGLQLHPGLGDITEHLVSLDPLYLMDEDEKMFKEVKKKWKQDYQRRLRYYVVNEQSKNPLGELPQGQFGQIVAVDYFNFRPLKLIESYIFGMFSALRPGGVAIFTFNNCDYPIGVDNFENSYYTYTPGHLLKDTCVRVGFKILASFDLDNNVSWLEIQRPGTRSSLKGGQSLAAIKHLGENK
jgi:hypothetical protein